jgi:pimeloyl-ACP methyl ester carboxylesterase
VRRIPTVLSTAALVLAGAFAAPVAAHADEPTPPGFQPAPIAWAPCTSPGLSAAGGECGFVEVPLDYAEPTGTKIKLAVSKIKASVPAEQYQGVMLVNPGGPGGSGLGYSQLGGAVPDGAGDAYDWIGFDPRGVGSSVPALSCVPDYAGYNRPDYQPEGGQEAEWLARAEAYAKACAANGGELLDHLTTVDTVTDIDSIRKALGAEQINWYGFSYGTYLGQVYGTLFPQNVRRMVLDGIVDERDVWYEANLNQDVAFERGIGEFFDWVAKFDSVYGLGATGDEVEALYYSTQDELRVTPAGPIGPSEWNDLFLGAGYNVQAWPGVADTFAAWVKDKDAAALKDAYDGSTDTTDDNGYAMYLATQCTDAQWPTDWDVWREDNTRVDAEAPFETWANAWFNAPCAFWPAEAGEPVDIDVSGVESALLINETFDGATPFNGALHARELFPNSALIEGVGGTTHSASLSGIACTDDKIAAYLATGELPERQAGEGSDVQCEPLPQPDPTAAADGGGESGAGAGARVAPGAAGSIR